MRVNSLGCGKVGPVISLSAAMAILFGCTTDSKKTRNPSSVESGLIGWVHTLAEDATKTVLTDANCVSEMDRIVSDVTHADPAQFSLETVETQSEPAIRELFDLRMSLLDRARPILLKGATSEKCALGLRRALRNIRGVEDFIGVVGFRAKKRELNSPDQQPRVSPGLDQLRVAHLPPPAIDPVFPAPGGIEGPSYVPASVLLNPSVKSAPGIRSGDILLSRGNAGASALIARMGQEDTNFSHMALVYVDPNDGKIWTIEAHIEYGSIIIPIDQWLSDGKSRTMIYRYPDAKVAAAAAQAMFDRVAPLFRAGNPIHYDFAFDMNDHSLLFCSEVARAGYEAATDGKLMLPLFPSKIAVKNRDLMNRLGIGESASFIPADIEIDPRFQVIGEWRNFGKLTDVWQKDAVLTSIYTWLERDGYKFEPSAGFSLKGYLAKALRNAGAIKDKMPKYMTHDVVVLNFMIDSMVEDFQKRLAAMDADQQKRTGFPLDYYQVLDALETMRKNEASTKRGSFKYLHP